MSKARLVNELDSLSEEEFQAVISNSKKHRKFLKPAIEGISQIKFRALVDLYQDAQQPKVTNLEFNAKFNVRISYAWREDLCIDPYVGVKVTLEDGTPCKEVIARELSRGVQWENLGLAKKIAGDDHTLLLAKQTKVVEEIQKVAEEAKVNENVIWNALNEYLGQPEYLTEEDEDEDR